MYQVYGLVFVLAYAQVEFSMLLIFVSINQCVYCALEHSQHWCKHFVGSHDFPAVGVYNAGETQQNHKWDLVKVVAQIMG
jgi:hypothetical protein